MENSRDPMGTSTGGTGMTISSMEKGFWYYQMGLKSLLTGTEIDFMEKESTEKAP